MVRPGIYQAVSVGSIDAVDRPVVIVNDSDVVVVDPTATPAAACALIADIKTLTPKPITTVINTHFHYDHSNGNEMFPPGVEIIAHEYAKQMIASGKSTSGRAIDYTNRGYGGQIASLGRIADTSTNTAKKDSLRQRAAAMQGALDALSQATGGVPTRTVTNELTITHSPRTIRLIHVGLAHTAGDIVVLLPNDHVLITGDMMQTSVPYLGDGYFPEWIASLDSLKKLDFEVVIPGHQAPFTQRERIDFLQDYLRDLWTQASALHAAGVTAADAATRIDLKRHATHFPGAAAGGVNPFATIRIWEILDGKR